MSTIFPMRAVISARVSVDDFSKGRKTREEQQAEASISIQGQVHTGERIIGDAGYTTASEPLVDDGVSGFKGAERKGFDKLMRLVIGGHVDVIVTRAVDRIGRNDGDNSAIRIAAAEAGVKFHLFSGQIIDPSEAGGKLNMQLMQGIAEYQSALKSETLRNVYGAMRDRGELRSGHKAFGWMWEKGKPELAMRAHPRERELVQEAFARVLGGRRPYTRDGVVQTSGDNPETRYSICADWNARGIPSVTGKAWSITALRSMLLRPSNAQFIREPGNGWEYDTSLDPVTNEVRRGRWDRLIDDETFLAARAILLSKARQDSPGRKHVHLLSGIVRCGLCSAPLQSSSVEDREGGRETIYRCVNKITMPTDKGVKHVSARTRALDTEVRRAVLAAFVYGPRDLFPHREPTREAEIYTKLDAIIHNRQEVLALVADGLVSQSEVRSQLSALKGQETALRDALDKEASVNANSMRLTDLRAGLWKRGRVDFDGLSDYRDALGARFDALDITQRRALVSNLLDIEVRPLARGVYGRKRWSIRHKVVTDLNDPDQEEL